MSMLNCSVCHENIPNDRILAGKAYCSCGCVITLRRGRREQQSSTGVVLFSILLVGAILHFMNWDKFALQIIPLKMKQLAQVANENDLVKIADICAERKKINCEIQALGQAHQVNNFNLDLLTRKSALHFKQKDHRNVVLTLATYYKLGGKDFSSRYQYAVSLGEIGKIQEAKKQFRFVLNQDHKKPQFQVARAYVDLLLKNNEYMNAKTVIEDYRRSAPQAGLFLEKELKFIEKTLNLASNANAIKTSRRTVSTFDN